MPETLIALFLAHVLADYVLQTRWMVDTKRGAGFAVHISIVFGTAVLCLGQVSLAVMAITFVHLAIDATKTLLMPDRLWSYLTDQALHLASILGIAALFPGAWQQGVWAGALPAEAPMVLAVVAGLVFATRGGHFAIAPYIAGGGQRATAQRSAMIGGLERTAVFAVVLIGAPALALGILAAKAVVWWTQGGRTAPGAEHAVAATLASFSWALGTGYATAALVSMA